MATKTASKPKKADLSAPRTAPSDPVEDNRVYSDEPTRDVDATPHNDPAPQVEPVPSHGQKRDESERSFVERAAAGEFLTLGSVRRAARAELDSK